MNVMFNILITILLVSLCHIVTSSETDPPEVELIAGLLNEPNSGNISSLSQKIFYFNLTNWFAEFAADGANVRVKVSVDEFSGNCPVLFSVRERRAVLSWQLPTVQADDTGKLVNYFFTERTLCSELGQGDLDEWLQIEVSSCSLELINFEVLLVVTNDIVIRLDDPPRTVGVSPVAPIYYRFDPHPTQTHGSLLVNIDDVADDVDSCLIFSIQKPTCPVMDQEYNVRFRGYWQTMTTQAAMLLRRGDYPDGFFIVLVALTNGERCTEVSSNYEYSPRSGSKSESSKNKVIINIEEVIEPEDYLTPVFVPLSIIIALILVIFVIFSIFQNVLERFKDSVQPSFISEMRPITRFHSQLCLEELKATRGPRKSHRYFWSVVTIGIFYCVPVIQLISNYLKVLYRTGDNDLCYYNYRCARPLGYVMDFNHIYSNIGYVLCGLTFILFVNFRQRSLNVEKFHPNPLDANANFGDDEASFDNDGILRKILPRIMSNTNNQYGTLQNYGVYYALGIALVLEGILSSAYHICPNQSNFQFDTSFMYVIAVLGIVKVYQYRHPVYLSANITFIGLAFVAASSVFGLLVNNLAFKICFSVFYFTALCTLLVYLYYVGYATDGNGVLITSWIEICKGVLHLRTMHQRTISHNTLTFSRILFPTLAILLNSILIILLWTIMLESNFATQLLVIFVANFAVYTLYYAAMKFVHGEYKAKLWIQLVIYGTLSLALWIISLYYFQGVQSSWEGSPAQSRELNEECILFSFYDNHDLWHFTSSAALLTSFMLLLTIDDDLIMSKHENIPVF